jgi:hypothetical protein
MRAATTPAAANSTGCSRLEVLPFAIVPDILCWRIFRQDEHAIMNNYELVE